ncbi:hypothetical protein M758_4G175100 [Ceratodon purpureus]|nr:hypothetical protein M758_4G175100 [Ceratodon purpureus]
MVHSSTHLALCWHLEQLLEDWGKKPGVDEDDGSGGGGHGGGWLEGKRGRRQRFREQGGPSREALQRSHIVSILRQIPELRFESHVVSSCGRAELEVASVVHDGCNGAVGDGKGGCEEGVSEEQLPGDVMWPLSAVSELGVDEIFRVDWDAIPAGADPLRGFGYKTPAPMKRRSSQGHGGGHDDDGNGEGEEGRLARGARKRSQVESIATALKFLKLPTGSVVVDFGCGSGALSLPLACVFKEFTFVCVDYKQESLRLLDLRAQAAKLVNITTWQGRIEDYIGPFDACVALHACGHATDLALMQALRWRAGYVASPCCVGKLQFAVGSPSFTGTIYDDNYTPENLRTARATKDGYVFPNLSNSGNISVHEQNGTHCSSTSVASRDSYQSEIENHEFSVDTLRNSRDLVGSFSKTLTPKQVINEKSYAITTHEIQAENLSGEVKMVVDHCLTYPRSRWLRSVITTDDFLLLARTADWSSYDYDSWTSRLHSLCKTMVELDRNLASQELGYRTSLLSLADQKAGAVGVSHILVGKPSMNSH